jgi:hypothetical protein
MVEFVLVLLPLLVFVGGVIQLGIGIANWHDLNRIANEGARFAAIDEWPDCPSGAQPCTGNPACNANQAALNGRSLTNYLRCEAVAAGMPGITDVVICRPGATAAIGEPVTVRLRSRLSFLSLDANDRNKASWLGLTLRGQATMRIERTLTTAPGACPP